MAITVFDQGGKEQVGEVFHLRTNASSYIMAVRYETYLTHVYWGKGIRTPGIGDASLLGQCGFDPMEKDLPFSLDYVRQEYPTGCGTDYRIPAFEPLYADGSSVAPLRYAGYRLYPGKQTPEGLPGLYAGEASGVDTLELLLTDEKKGLEITLSYSVFEKADAIVRSVRVENKGTEDVRVERLMSCSVDFESGDYDMLRLPGAWGRERHIEKSPLRHGLCAIGSGRGASSHQMNPFFALLEPGADETRGSVYGFNLVYSGNFTAGAEIDQLGMLRAFMGLGDRGFSWLLEPGQGLSSPEAVMVYSGHGLGELSRKLHRLYRAHLLRGKYKDGNRPILANNWEATYFDFDEEKIVALARKAAELGIELMVLDDGWFGKRDSDACSLGDWQVNRKKLPSGLKGLAERVEAEGVRFGLWFEPEMVSPDSELYRSHPDWCIHAEGRERTECRNQLTLDLSRAEVCDFIVDVVNGILKSAPISYVKWDMNRHMSNLGSAGLCPARQREMSHRYMLGLYGVLERIVSANPDVLFESCSGGGGRFDPGMLYYMPQIWTSDDTDPVERLYIQYGTSLAYPISTMGAHVSAVPNHQSGRTTSMKMRGDVAMSGNLGYELDLTALSGADEEQIQAQIRAYKELRSFLFAGDFYRLKNPFEGNEAAWMVLSEDGGELFAVYVRIQARVNAGIARMKFAALEADADYRDVESGRVYHGDELMEIGIPVEPEGDYWSRTWHLRKIGY